MNWQCILGIFLMASPFVVALAITLWIDFKGALIVWGAASVMLALFWTGVYLVNQCQ